MRKITLLIAILGVLNFLSAQDTKKVLFLGNSYTFYNDLPSLVSQMATNTGDVLIYDSNTPGGFRFMHHASNLTTQNKIDSDDWDYVTLQAQSQETSWSQDIMETDVFPYALQLVNAIRANNPCSQPLFYMTWGRENGDIFNCGNYPWVCTYEGMDDAIRATYIYMAETYTTEVSPVGAVWRYLRTHHPEIDLYLDDASHPSLTGSYAAACAFYTMIYKKDPTLMTWNSTLDEATANTIKSAAKLVVFDVINDWDFTANFDFVVDDNLVTFTNTYPADTVSWNFDDGNSSTENNPTHTYNATGDFDVTLTITACGRTHTLTKTVSVSNLSLEDNVLSGIKIYPNPTKDEIIIDTVNTNNYSATLYSILGQKVMHYETLVNNTISLSGIKSGTYFLKISSGNSSQIKKVIKL